VLPQHRGPVTQERTPKMRQGKERTPSGENSVTRYTIPHTDMETPGMHTWMVWRRNLTDFAQLLFR